MRRWGTGGLTKSHDLVSQTGVAEPGMPAHRKPRLEMLSHERFPVRTRLRYENPMWASEIMCGVPGQRDLNL